MNYLPLIITLVLILACCLAVFCLIRYIRQKARNLSRALFGTENLAAGARELKEEYAATPKSVSGMTHLLLPKLAADFPEFQYDEMKGRAENVLTSYLKAVSAGNPSLLTEGSAELKEQLAQHIRELSGRGEREHFDQIRLHRTELNQYRKTDGRCIVTFQTALECYHYKENSSGLLDGSRDYKYQTKFNTDLIYVQDRELAENASDGGLGVNCPNCGAPLSSLGAKVCEYCGSPVVEINIHAWAFGRVTEIM